MPEFSAAHTDGIVAACRANAGELAESLHLCFGIEGALTIGEALPWTVDAIADQPGLLFAFRFGKRGLLCLLPGSVPLPSWYEAPDAVEEARLQTLALEWSLNLFPPELAAAEFAAKAVPSLLEAVSAARPDEGAVVIPFTLSGAGTPLMLVLPVADAPLPAEPAAPVAAPMRAAGAAFTSPRVEPRTADVSRAVAAPTIEPACDGMQRLMDLPVEISVRLAEKRIELGSLLGLAPGALITFNKPCEELLDLYVNNHRYCRGEAVKIGEKFGLKINQVGVVEYRTNPVM